MTDRPWKPHSYQRTALSFLLSFPRSGLFLDPGLGKTSISLSAIRILKYSKEIKAVLIVAPLRVCYSVWPDELGKWVNFKGLSHTILHGATKPTLWGEQVDIYLINPEGLSWLHNELLNGLKAGKKCPFDALWIDESTKFKSHGSVRYKYLTDMLPLFKRRHIMTGTPAPKSLLDLWSQCYILDEGEALGKNFHRFRNKYFESNDWNKYTWNIKDFSKDSIKDKMAHLVLEMSAKDHLDMPDILFNDISVQLPIKAMKYYKRMEQEFFIELDNMEVSADANAQVSMKCHQIANGKVYEDIPKELSEGEEREFRKTRKTVNIHQAKVEILKNLIDELNGKPLLIAYHYKHDLEALRTALGNDLPFIGSGVNPKDAKSVERRWNAREIPILAGHPASMAHGLNLQGSGNDICWYSLTWNLEEYLQFNARIYRQGVSGSVRVHHLVAKDTVDEAMLIRLGERSAQQKSLREALKQYRIRL